MRTLYKLFVIRSLSKSLQLHDDPAGSRLLREFYSSMRGNK